MPDEIGQINVLYKLLKSCFVATYLGRSATMSWTADQSLSEKTHKKTQIKNKQTNKPRFFVCMCIRGMTACNSGCKGMYLEAASSLKNRQIVWVLPKSRKGLNGWFGQLWLWWENSIWLLKLKSGVFLATPGWVLSLRSGAWTWFLTNCYHFWKNLEQFAVFRKVYSRVFVGKWKCCQLFLK